MRDGGHGPGHGCGGCGGGFIAEDEYVAGADISSEVLADAEENVDIR